MPIKTQCNLALEALKATRSKGIHSFELNKIIGSTRSAARIQDLKDKGYTIMSKPEKMGKSWGVRYFLDFEAPKKPVFNQERQVFEYV